MPTLNLDSIVVQGNKSMVPSNIGVSLGVYKCFVEINACALGNA